MEQGRDIEIPLTLNVYDIILPSPSEWSFHLDLWQNPWAIARYHDVEPWTEEHLEISLPYLELLAETGQKCIADNESSYKIQYSNNTVCNTL